MSENNLQPWQQHLVESSITDYGKMTELAAAVAPIKAENEEKAHQAQLAAEALTAEARQKAEFEAKTKEQLSREITARISEYDAVLPFLEENKETVFAQPDGSRVLMVKNEDRVLMMHTTDPDRHAPTRHYWNMGQQIASDDVLGWQIVTFRKVNKGQPQAWGLYHYSRQVLDEIRDKKRSDGWYAADPNVNSNQLNDKSLEELRELHQKIATVLPIPEGLKQLESEFQQKVVELTQLTRQVQEKRQKYGVGKPLKIVGQEKWLFFSTEAVYVLNKPDSGQKLLNKDFPLQDIDLEVSDAPTSPNVLKSTDMAKMKADQERGDFSLNLAQYYHSQYEQRATLVPGKLEDAVYQVTKDNLQIIIDLELEENDGVVERPGWMRVMAGAPQPT